ncbi:MAG: hypothetical protein OHK0044_32190 [Burkholderiaceae bacterium]
MPVRSGLNPQQRAAAEHGADGAAGPLLVIAGAGSGKTDTLAHRVACLIERGADPRAILLLTFSRRAAVEMTRRVERIVAAAARAHGRPAAIEIPWAGTFHAIGARLLREHAARIGLAPDFTIHDREDSADLMNLVRNELALSKTDKRFPLKGTCLAIYSRTVKTEQPLGDVLAQWFPWCAEWQAQLRGLFAAYDEAKQRQRVLDYDDLLLYWAATMAEPALAAAIRARFSHVLVDEYQDTNRLQASILHALKPDGDGLTVVGDDAQSIYSFRGATVRNILDFPRQFGRPATVITLERNYRCTQPILAAANAVIALAAERYAKNLHSERASTLRPRLVSVTDEAAQARYVAEQVLAARERGVALRAQAVLFRAAQHSAQLELELGRRDIPFVKFGGLRFLEAAHVKDLLACLRWAANPRDRVSGLRVQLLLPGVGPRTAARALDLLAEARDAAAALTGFEATAAIRDDLCALAVLVRTLRDRTAVWPAELALARRWYEPHLQRLYEDAAYRAADLAALEHIAGTYPSVARALSDRGDARPARGHERRSRRTAARRGLSDAVDDPFGQGAGVERGLRAERRRRLHPVRSGHRNARRDRGAAAAAVRGDGAREGRVAHHRAAALLRDAAVRRRRPPRVRDAHAVHPRRTDGPVRDGGVARGRALRGGHGRAGRTDRHRRETARHVALSGGARARARRARGCALLRRIGGGSL